MIVDGKALAQELLTNVAQEIQALPFSPKLGVLTCAPGPETRQYLELKRKRARAVGINLSILELPDFAHTEDCITALSGLARDAHGVLVQLPLPSHIDRELVLQAVPVEKDPDGFSYAQDSQSVLPPVVGAIEYISHKHSVVWQGKKVAVVGYGRLVGQPAEKYALSKGAEVAVLTEESSQYLETLQTADIVVSGVGKAHFITSDMVKDGVVIFDAGASEDGGVIVGDVHPEVVDRATLFTPVPGGIGPITIAVLLDNVLTLAKQSQK